MPKPTLPSTSRARMLVIAATLVAAACGGAPPSTPTTTSPPPASGTSVDPVVLTAASFDGLVLAAPVPCLVEFQRPT